LLAVFYDCTEEETAGKPAGYTVMVSSQ